MSQKKRILGVALLLIVGIASCSGLRWPSREFRSWTPETIPVSTGVLKDNKKLQKTEMLGDDSTQEPEDVAIAENGWIYTGCIDGKIRRIDPTGKKVEVVADTKGRPLGLVFDKQKNLIVADGLKGLLSVSPKGKVRVLVNKYKGKPLCSVDDLDIDSSGNVYFSDASRFCLFDLENMSVTTRIEIMARVPTGRLFRYDPKTQKTTLLLDNLHFANGVSVSEKSDYVLVTETSDYSVRRYWLKGKKAGTSDVFAKNLPGYPDNINRSSQGGFWVGLTSKRIGYVDRHFHPRAWLKKLIVSMPTVFLPKPVKASLVIHLDGKGTITENFQDPTGKVIANVSSATEFKGHLYLGHIYRHSPKVGRFKLEK